MSVPVRKFRGDVVIKMDLDATDGVGVNYTPVCGATSGSINLQNEIRDESHGDCVDWSAPIQTLTSYGKQSWSLNAAVTLAKSNYDKLMKAAARQLEVPVMVHITDAEVDQLEFIEGVLMFESLAWEGLGNVEGAALTSSLSCRFRETPELIDREA